MDIFGSWKKLVSVVFAKDSQAITMRPNQSTTYTAARDIQLPPGDAAHVLQSADSAQTVSNKTMDNTNTMNLKDTLWTLEDDGDANKKMRFQLSAITSGQTRTITIPDANSTMVNIISSQTLQNKIFDNTNEFTTKDTLWTLQDDGDATKQMRFQLSGITTGNTRVFTMPDASATLVGADTAQTLTNKDIDGGTAANTRRITLPKDTTANLAALTRKQGTIVYNTTTNKLNVDDGSALNELSTAVDASASVSGQVNTTTQSFGGAKNITLIDSSQSIPTAAGITSLTATSPVLTIFTGSSTQTVKLPDTSTLTVGYRYKIQNISSSTTPGSVSIQTSTGVQLTSLSGKATINASAHNGYGAIFECISTADNTAASWMQVGNNTEYYEAAQGTPTDTDANNTWSDGATLSIPPGLWDFSGYADFSIGAATSVSAALLGISTTSGNSGTGLTFGVNAFSIKGPDATADMPIYVPGYRVSVTSTTTYYLKVKANFVGGASRPQVAFIFRARRYK